MRSEKDLHTAFMAWLKKHGIPYFHSRMDAKTSQACGDPDFVCVKAGKVALVEFKHGKNKLSGDQQWRIIELETAGCAVCVAYDLQTAVSHVEAQLMPGAVTGHPASPEGVSEPAAKQYLIQSRHMGPLVVTSDATFIRLAKPADMSLPAWTEALG